MSDLAPHGKSTQYSLASFPLGLMTLLHLSFGVVVGHVLNKSPKAPEASRELGHEVRDA